MDKSIYKIDENDYHVVLQYISVMKIIMVKGIGYVVVSKDTQVTPDTFLSIGASMENQNIKAI